MLNMSWLHRMIGIRLMCVFSMAGQVVLWTLRSSRNAVAPPMLVVFDVQSNLFIYTTRFNAKVQSAKTLKLYVSL